jgi:CubicO group peptidase (beta-lactamase class C family)
MQRGQLVWQLIGASASIAMVTVVSGAVGLAPVRASQAGGAPIEERVDRLFARWQAPDSPGCSVGVSRGGATLLERGYGRASLELGVPITPASVFHVASVTKQFTAMSILLLASDGKLSLDDDVRRHLPEWMGPPGVSIRHLLTHTGGLRDAFLLIEMAAPETGRSTHDQLVGLLARQRGLSEAPGTRYVYNNGGYVLLAEIVRRVSGQSLRAFAEARIFGPLGMRQTHLHDDLAEIVPQLATGYTRRGDGSLRLARPGGGVVGNGGLFTTVGDLLRWERNFAAPRVGDAALIASMETPPALPGGETTAYAFGVQLETIAGRRTIGHGGGDEGVSAYVVRYPDHDLAVAVLCNLDEIDSIDLARGVAGLYLGDIKGPADAAADRSAAAPVPPADLAADEGLYRDPTDEALLRIFVRDGTLRGSSGAGADGGWPLVPLGANRFRIPTTAITLEFEAGAGGARTLRVVGERPTPAVLERVASYTPSAAAVAALAGDYRSDELSTTYALRVRDGALIADVPGRASIALQPIRADTFAGSMVGVITFSRDRGGRATGFTVHAYAARGLRFDRVRQEHAP